MDIILRTQTEWDSLTVLFLRKMDRFAFALISAGWTQCQSKIHTRYKACMNVLIPFVRQRCFRHRTLVANIGKSKWPKKTKIDHIYIPSWPSRPHSHALRIGEYSWDISTSNESYINESKRKFSLVCLDDIFILWCTSNEFFDHSRKVLTVF